MFRDLFFFLSLLLLYQRFCNRFSIIQKRLFDITWKQKIGKIEWFKNSFCIQSATRHRFIPVVQYYVKCFLSKFFFSFLSLFFFSIICSQQENFACKRIFSLFLHIFIKLCAEYHIKCCICKFHTFIILKKKKTDAKIFNKKTLE